MATAIIDHISRTLLRKDFADLEPVEQAVIQRMIELAPDTPPEPAKSNRLDALADRIALAFGSWWFVAGTVFVMTSWFLVNSSLLVRGGVALDPYPYTFLRLVLSVLAVVQGPIILISQHHTDASKRVAKSYDLAVAMQAKLEILRLHERFDGFEAALAERRLGESAGPMPYLALSSAGGFRPRAANSDVSSTAPHAVRRLVAHRRSDAGAVRTRPVAPQQPGSH
jgi:uncharacterized membrane protein